MTLHHSERRQLVAALLLVAVALLAVILSRGSSNSDAAVSHRVESMFQDDGYLLYNSTPVVTRTLDTLRSLGVDEIRATILWKAIAPDAGADTPPRGFQAADPAAYPASAWVPYDRLVTLARTRGILVDFNVTAPGPLWAMAHHAPTARYADHWAPSPQAFGLFAQALGERYSGRYSASPGAAPLPRVGFWSIWNEPNQPGWLAPQWQTLAGSPAPVSPVLYRAYLDAAWSGLARTGHDPAHDTILVGELAPEGSEGPRFNYGTATPPLSFLRALYCVGRGYRPLRGASAANLGCPQDGTPSAFVSAHPALFQATGLAHHPYSFFLPPDASLPDPNFVPLSDLSRLEHSLDATLSAYDVGRRLPLWLTEYGYETNPPNPFRGVSLRAQSLYLNEAQYMAFRDPRVRSLSQFLLYDSLPDSRYPRGSERYWSTFQTGLLFANGSAKPSFYSYRLPLFVPHPVLSGNRRVLIWAMLRAAPPGTRQRVLIQWRTQQSRSYRVIGRTVIEPPADVLVQTLTLPGRGVIRVVWTAPGGTLVYSRGVGIRG